MTKLEALKQWDRKQYNTPTDFTLRRDGTIVDEQSGILYYVGTKAESTELASVSINGYLEYSQNNIVKLDELARLNGRLYKWFISKLNKWHFEKIVDSWLQMDYNDGVLAAMEYEDDGFEDTQTLWAYKRDNTPSDPIKYIEDEMGKEYIVKEAFENNLIDKQEVINKYIELVGLGTILSPLDGEETQLDGGYYLYRMDA